MEIRNWFQVNDVRTKRKNPPPPPKKKVNDSASLCSLAGRYNKPIPIRYLAPIDFLKIPSLGLFRGDCILRLGLYLTLTRFIFLWDNHATLDCKEWENGSVHCVCFRPDLRKYDWYVSSGVNTLLRKLEVLVQLNTIPGWRIFLYLKIDTLISLLHIHIGRVFCHS